MAIFALVDCNNFFVSCERAFAPQYNNKPVVVLSNNDGCIVSRSQEAKNLGIPMAGAFFKVRHIAQQHGVVAFSSNYALYGDFSRRVMEVLRLFSPHVELYSVDEAFLYFPEEKTDFEALGAKIRETVYQWTGIPVSVGFASTKTLAKIATDYAKKKKTADGVYSLLGKTEAEMNAYLNQVLVTDVWGIGRQRGPFLLQHGIRTAKDLKDLSEAIIRRYLTVQGARTVRELRGEVCFGLEPKKMKKHIASTRSFRRYITLKHELAEAVSTYAARAAKKLRSEKGKATIVTVYIRTNHHSKNHPQYHKSTSVELPLATDSTPKLIEAALSGLEAIFIEGYAYQKAGVILGGITADSFWQETLWEEESATHAQEQTLMKCLDSINKKWGGDTMYLAAEGIQKTWSAKIDMRSPRYTTTWKELLSVKIA